MYLFVLSLLLSSYTINWDTLANYALIYIRIWISLIHVLINYFEKYI